MPAEKRAMKLIYRSGTSGCLGPGWDVIQVALQREDHGVMRNAASASLAPNANGAVIPKNDTLLDRWEQVTDRDALRACHEFFDNRGRLLAEQAVRGGKGVSH
jgi:homoserine kinase